MKKKSMQCENGDENTIIETKKLSMKKECKNITIPKIWMKKCPNCNSDIFYKHQSGLIYSLNNNTVCKPCSYKKIKSFKNKFEKLCTECNCTMYYSTKRSLIRSLKINSKCRRCISKNSPSPMSRVNYNFSKEHRQKIGIKSTLLQTGKKHSDERIKNMVSGIVNMSYDEWIKICPEILRYRKKVHYFSRKNCKINNLENFGMKGYDMDHIFPVSECFKLNIPVEIASDITNLRMIPSIDNKQKSNKIDVIPEIIKPFYEKNSKY
jgi:hypothetical protein